MENLDVIIFSSIVAVAFIVFIVTCIKEFSKMGDEEYVYDPKQRKFGRDKIFDMVEKMFDDKTVTKEEKVKLIKTLDRTIADMESDGLYFSKEVKEKLEQQREFLFCEYSGLPSPKAYDTNQV